MRNDPGSASPETPSIDAVADGILEELKCMGSEAELVGMVHSGISVDNAFGVSIYDLRKMAASIGTDHELALALWETGNHEARLLACFIDDPVVVTLEQMEAWAACFDSWDICDQTTTSLFDMSAHAWPMAVKWAGREGEWVKRAGFAMMAGLAAHDRKASDRDFERLFDLIEQGASDSRNFVKKAVNWALRNIGKRNLSLNSAAVACAERISRAANLRAGAKRGGDPDARAARWVAADALRELRSEKVPVRLNRRG